jgi:hypothetical protein
MFLDKIKRCLGLSGPTIGIYNNIHLYSSNLKIIKYSGLKKKEEFSSSYSLPRTIFS